MSDRKTMVLWTSAVLLLSRAAPVVADAVGDAAQGMGDWLMASSLLFGGVAVVVFLVALKRGYFRDLEQAKYHMLTINEPDYYTPEWAKEENDGRTDGPPDRGAPDPHGEHD